MSEFQTKTYRCEWVAEVFPVDQYDKRQNEEPFYEAAFPTRREALDDLLSVTTHHPNSPHRRIYRDAPHGYYSTGVRYREVEIKAGEKLCAICSGKHDNDALTDICTDCEQRINDEGSP